MKAITPGDLLIVRNHHSLCVLRTFDDSDWSIMSYVHDDDGPFVSLCSPQILYTDKWKMYVMWMDRVVIVGTHYHSIIGSTLKVLT